MQPEIVDSYSPWISARNRIWESVLHLGKKHCYDKGNFILGGGHPTDHLYYLHTGQVKYSLVSPEGNEKIIWYLDNGNIFGAAPFFEGSPMGDICSAITALEKCEVYIFSRDCFNNEIVVKYPELVTNLIQSMAFKIFLAVNRGGDLTSLPSRVCKILIYLLQREGDGDVNGRIISSKGISQQELAFILGVHRVTLGNAITRLKQEGIIEHISKRRLVVNSAERLREYARM